MCADATLDTAAYSELLGWYLGDGCLVAARRAVWKLEIADDARHALLHERVAHLVGRVKPGAVPHRRTRPGAVCITAGWKHWPCLFPQHGPGKKHERDVSLVDWQREVVAAHPWGLLRGLLHADGSRFTNTVRRRSDRGTKTYSYPRWMFVNRSEDVLRLCADTFDDVGVHWTPTRSNCLAVSRRDDVARLDRLVGPKS